MQDRQEPTSVFYVNVSNNNQTPLIFYEGSPLFIPALDDPAPYLTVQ